MLQNYFIARSSKLRLSPLCTQKIDLKVNNFLTKTKQQKCTLKYHFFNLSAEVIQFYNIFESV